jgi:hypothetical protein
MPLDSGQREMCDLEWWIMLYHVAVRWEGLGVANAWRTITASMCRANSEIWRWHYSVGVFFTEWTWPSRNSAWKSKHGRIQGHSDPLHSVYGRRPVRRWLSVSACSAPCHKARSVRGRFLDNKVPEMDCPSQSPDLNPTKHLWHELERQLRYRPQCPTTLTAPVTTLQEEWAAIPPETFRQLAESLPGRVRAVIKAKGGPNRY